MIFDEKEYNRKWYREHPNYWSAWRKKNPDKVSLANKRNHSKRLRFQDKQIILEKNPRTGECSICHKKVGQEIQKTDLHHIQYHEEDPLKDIVELCVACHRKEHARLRRLQ